MGIVRRQKEHDEEIFRLYGEVFGSSMSETSRARWRWQYLDNPCTGPEGPDIWVALEEGRVLGQYASMPVRLWWDGREVEASWGMDVFLRAEARGKGVGAKLFTAWSDHVEVALGLGLTPSSYGLFKKLRYHDVGPVSFFQKVLDPSALVARRAGHLAGALLGPALGSVLRVRHPERHDPEARMLEVRPITGFTPEYDRLWERARASYAMCVRRDREYLEWKYGRPPQRDYALREARRGGELVGFAVSREEDYRGVKLGWLIDVFADAADHAAKDALVGALLAGFREAGVARAQAFSMNQALAQDLRRRGFFAASSPMQFCVRTRVGGETALAELGRWHVVFGDSDMDR